MRRIARAGSSTRLVSRDVAERPRARASHPALDARCRRSRAGRNRAALRSSSGAARSGASGSRLRDSARAAAAGAPAAAPARRRTPGIAATPKRPRGSIARTRPPEDLRGRRRAAAAAARRADRARPIQASSSRSAPESSAPARLEAEALDRRRKPRAPTGARLALEHAHVEAAARDRRQAAPRPASPAPTTTDPARATCVPWLRRAPPREQALEVRDHVVQRLERLEGDAAVARARRRASPSRSATSAASAPHRSETRPLPMWTSVAPGWSARNASMRAALAGAGAAAAGRVRVRAARSASGRPRSAGGSRRRRSGRRGAPGGGSGCSRSRRRARGTARSCFRTTRPARARRDRARLVRRNASSSASGSGEAVEDLEVVVPGA